MSTTIAPAGATQRAFTTGGYLQSLLQNRRDEQLLA